MLAVKYVLKTSRFNMNSLLLNLFLHEKSCPRLGLSRESA